MQHIQQIVQSDRYNRVTLPLDSVVRFLHGPIIEWTVESKTATIHSYENCSIAVFEIVHYHGYSALYRVLAIL